MQNHRIPNLFHLRLQSHPMYFDCLSKLPAARSNLERVTLVANIFSKAVDIEYAAKIGNITTLKSCSMSLSYRNEGNVFYGNREYLKSLFLYNASISHAPVNTPELALAYANRSIVLRELGKLTECISDLQRALVCGYPKPLRYKLFLREAQCRRDLGQSKQALGCFELALKALESSDLSSEKKHDVAFQINQEKRMKARNVTDLHRIFLPTDVPTVSYGPSEEVPCASSSIRLCYNNKYGRHFVASREINAGDVLFVEDPYVDGLSYDPDLPDCVHCHNPCFTLLPCPNCVWAMFCSDKCQDEAAKQYHLEECPILDRFLHLVGEYRTHAVLVTRAVVKVGLVNLAQYFGKQPDPETNEAKRTKGFNSDGKYDSSDFQTIFHLFSNISKRSDGGQFDFCLAALELAKCFNPTNYLKTPHFTALLVHLLEVFESNCVGINYFNMNSLTSCVTQSFVTNGSAAYPAMSLLSHSCDPNTLSVNYGRKLVLYASRPIPKGVEVTMHYIDPFFELDKLSRHQQLSNNYKFQCLCEACENNWPLFQYLPALSKIDMRLLANPKIIDKLNRSKVEPLPYILNSLVKKNRESLVSFVDRALRQRYEIVTHLYNKKKYLNEDFVRLNIELTVLLSSLGTVVTNIN